MKNIIFLLFSILILTSCFNGNDEPDDEQLNSELEEPIDLVEKAPANSTESISFTKKAKFIGYELGDMSHFTFEDESGKNWDFSGCEDRSIDFARELGDNEIEKADERNQGWGSNKDLEGKWFLLTIEEREQQLYIDGPVGTVSIIIKAVQVAR